MQARGEPVIVSLKGSTAGQINLLDANCSTRTLTTSERFILSSFSFIIDTVADGDTAWLSVSSTASTVPICLLTNAISLGSASAGGAGAWNSAPQDEGVSFPVGATPWVALEAGAITFVLTGTGYIVNAGGYVGRPPYRESNS